MAGTPFTASLAPATDYRRWIKRAVGLGVAGMALSVLLDWGIVRAVYGDQFAGHAGLHIRFGPKATATTAKPSPSQKHP